MAVDDYLEQVLGENEEFSMHARGTELASAPFTRAEAQAKIERGLAQIERGQFVDGEQFMAELLSGIEKTG